MSQPFDRLAVLAEEAAPQLTVAEAQALEMEVVQIAMSSLFSDTASRVSQQSPEPEADEQEASEQNQDSEHINQRSNPQAVGTSTVKRKNRTTQTGR